MDQEAVPSGSLAAPKDKRILIVDDDETVRGFLELAAQTEGFEVLTAGNGLEAAQKIGDRPPDLIITDLMMPGQGGYEFLRSLQGSGRGRIPVFVARLHDVLKTMPKELARSRGLNDRA